jgi:hypothetical protein
MRILIFTMLYFSVNSFGQSNNLFNNPEAAKTFFDGKIYEVPSYGTLTFSLNKALTKLEADKRVKDGSYDELVDLVFDVSVKRNNVKKKDKGDYKVSMTIYLTEEDDPDADPNKGYSMDFTLSRQIIYPIKGFPSQYTVFADGDLFFWKYEYKKYTFEEYKRIKLEKKNTQSETKLTLIQCNPK